jgi:hypothetical protein
MHLGTSEGLPPVQTDAGIDVKNCCRQGKALAPGAMPLELLDEALDAVVLVALLLATALVAPLLLATALVALLLAPPVVEVAFGVELLVEPPVLLAIAPPKPDAVLLDVAPPTPPAPPMPERRTGSTPSAQLATMPTTPTIHTPNTHWKNKRSRARMRTPVTLGTWDTRRYSSGTLHGGPLARYSERWAHPPLRRPAWQ